MDKSEYLLIELKEAEIEMIKALEMKEIREQHRYRQMKELENDLLSKPKK
jgi:hypothetical protein